MKEQKTKFQTYLKSQSPPKQGPGKKTMEQSQQRLSQVTASSLGGDRSDMHLKSFTSVVKNLQFNKHSSQKISFHQQALVEQEQPQITKFQSVNVQEAKQSMAAQEQNFVLPPMSFKQTASNKIIEKKKKDEQAIKQLNDRLKNVLLLKNNIKGTDTTGFRKNKDIQSQWTEVIEDICLRRENKKQDIASKEKLIKDAQQRFVSLDLREAKTMRETTLQLPPNQREESKEKSKRSVRKNQEYSLFKAIKKHSIATDGSPMTQVVNTLQTVANRVSKLQKNPHLQYKFDPISGDRYILKLDKRTQKKKKPSSNFDSVVSQGEHFLDAQMRRKRKLRKELLQAIQKVGEVDLSSSSEEDTKKNSSPMLKYQRQTTMKNVNINKLMNYYSQRTLTKDFQTMFKDDPSLRKRQQSLKSIETEIYEESDQDSLPSPQRFMIKKELVPFDQVLFKSLKRDRVRGSQLIETLKEEQQRGSIGKLYDKSQRGNSQAKLDKQQARLISERLATPKVLLPFQYFGVPRKECEFLKPQMSATINNEYRPCSQILSNYYQKVPTRNPDIQSLKTMSNNQQKTTSSQMNSLQRNTEQIKGKTTETDLNKSSQMTNNPTQTINIMIKELRDLQKQEAHNQGCNVLYRQLNKDLDNLFTRSTTLLKIGVKPRTIENGRMQRSITVKDLAHNQEPPTKDLKIAIEDID